MSTAQSENSIKGTDDSFRRQDNASLPFYYHWFLHVAVNFTAILTLLGTAGLRVWNSENSFSAVLIGCFVPTWALIEYGIHRYLLHGKSPFLQRLAREHSFNHHRYFTQTHMYSDRPIDLSRVFLMPSHLLGLLAVNGGISWILETLRPGIGWSFFAAGLLYLLAYEVMHGLCHSSLSSRSVWIRKIQEHHRFHHGLRNMAHSNFAIVFPFLDHLFGTYRREI